MASAKTDLPPGWLTDREAEALAELARDKVVLEVGAWLGRSTMAMARTAHLVISVDHHRGSEEHQEQARGSAQFAAGLTDPKTGEHSTLRRFLQNTAGAANVVPMIAPFQLIAHHLRGCGMAFIDAQHDHESVLRDAQDAFDCVLWQEGAPLVFHDYGAWSGVVSAVSQLRREWRALLEGVPGTSLAVLRRG